MAATVDVAIFGGGIAGLWLLARLVRAGRSAWLFEADRLGAGQTIASQGIIHGGLKYALSEVLDGTPKDLAAMPERWRSAVVGTGEIDLAAVDGLVDRHLMLVPGGLGGRLKALAASPLVASRVDPLATATWPETLRDGRFQGTVLALDEPVVDVGAVVRCLAARFGERIRRLADAEFVAGPGAGIGEVRLPQGGAIRARAYVFAAGAGNEAIARRLGCEDRVTTQRRPLHMAMARGVPGPLSGHVSGAFKRPRLTVTTHRLASGELVWYLGGDLAEAGVDLDAPALAARAQAELARLLPGLETGGWRWAGLRIDRAEPRDPRGRLPAAPVVRGVGNALFAWPVKLAYAPLLADMLIRDHLPEAAPTSDDGAAAIAALPPAEIAPAPWETASWS